MKSFKKIQNGIYSVKNYYLFSFLKLFSIWENEFSKTYNLFGIPVLKIKKGTKKSLYKLFSILPLFKKAETEFDPYENINVHYQKVLKKLKAKVNKGEKIRVSFYIVEVFQYASLFEEMQKSDIFDPFIVVIPDVNRKEKMLQGLKNSYNALKVKYDNVYIGYDEEKDEYLDFSKKMDIVFFGNPYQGLVHNHHFIWHMLDKNILTCYQNYGFNTVIWGRDYICGMPFYNACWKVFVDSDESYQDLLEYQPRKGKNAFISGYCKMDKLASVERAEKLRKQVLLCPHHTIDFECLQLSNFLKYADFFLELPKKYPDIDFIFRPHQLLRYNLAKYWSEEKAQEYYDNMLSNPNVKYSTGQDYFQTFIDSDAMIHDCGSFTAEYLFVNKPCCYMLKSEKEIDSTFLPIGKKSLDNYYKAFSEEDICNFIENVVVNENDPLKEERTKFSEKLKLNYPFVGGKIVEYIKNEILSQELK